MGQRADTAGERGDRLIRLFVLQTDITRAKADAIKHCERTIFLLIWQL